MKTKKMNSDDSDENFADLDEAAEERIEEKYGELIRNLDILKIAGVKQ